MRRRLWGIAALVPALFLGTAMAQTMDDEALHDFATTLFEPIPTELPELSNNPITDEKIELGRMLFFEPRLSSSHLLSCNTCHNVGIGGVDGLEVSIGHGWQAGPRNSPTVFNSFYNVAQFWDGRAADLMEQAQGPIQAAVEMNATPERVLTVLNSLPEYQERFAEAFPGEDDPVTFENVARAIEAYEVTLTTPNAPFDEFLRGDLAALNEDEKRGLDLFMNVGCASCHSGINVGGGDYFAFGVIEQPGAEILPREDRGRFAVTETASDEYVFRAPPLRNVALTAPYFHSGGVWDLEQAVAIMGTAQLGADLEEEQIQSIVAFLHTLTGDQPQETYPILPPNGPTTPRPELMLPAAN